METHYGVQSPKTPAEWQLAVDSAETLLTLVNARASGLVSGGPRVNQKRCRELLELGRSRGFSPAPDIWQRFLEQCRAQEDGEAD